MIMEGPGLEAPQGRTGIRLVGGASIKRKGEQNGTAIRIWALESDFHSSWVILGKWISEPYHKIGAGGEGAVYHLSFKDAMRVNDDKHLALSF